MSITARRRDVTVADVAKEAQVSKATAARVLGNYGAVSDEVRSRVVAAAESLDYRPNELARTMNTGISHTLGVIVGDIENPYFGAAMRGISDKAKAKGFDVILVNTSEDVSAEVDAVKVLLDKRVDGVIVAPASSTHIEHLHEIVESGRPLVLFDRRVPELNVEVVASEVEEAAYEATEHLLLSGHQRIAYISTMDVLGQPYHPELALGASPITDRLAGMRRALEDAGLPLDNSLIRLGARSPEHIRDIVADLVDGAKPATAIVASDSLIALSVLEALHSMDLTIPGDVSFIMYDDFPWTRLVSPPITVISQPVYDLGAAAAEILTRQISGQPVGEVPTFPAKLIRRESVGTPASSRDLFPA